MLSNRLKQLRIEKGITQKEMAKDLGTTDVSIGRYEKGEREPKTDMLNTLANYFDVTTDYLLGRTDIKNNSNSNKINANKNDNENDIEKIIDELMEQKGLMLCGEPMSEEDMFLLRNSIRSTIELAKTMKGNKK